MDGRRRSITGAGMKNQANYEGVEQVTYQQWERCARRQEKKNLREKGRSLTFTAIARRANAFIIEIQPGKSDREGILVVRNGWREAMQTEE